MTRSYWLAAAIVAAFVAGCSMVRVGYNQVDTLALWTADRYFDLDAQQENQFRARFARLHEWHRHEELPDYAQLLAQARIRVEKGVTREDVFWMIEAVKTRYRRIVARSAPDAAALLMTLTPEQIEALKLQWEKDNRKFAAEYALDGTPEEKRKARLKRSVEQIERWTGRLTDEQERRIGAMIDAMPEIARLRHEDRLRRQREFLQLLAQRRNRERFAAELQRWLTDWETSRAPDFTKAYARWVDLRADMTVELNRMLTSGQRATMLARMQDYIDDFRVLAEAPGTRVAAH